MSASIAGGLTIDVGVQQTQLLSLSANPLLSPSPVTADFAQFSVRVRKVRGDVLEVVNTHNELEVALLSRNQRHIGGVAVERD